MSELVLKNTTLGIPEVTPEAFKLRESAIALAAPIQSVTNDQELVAAVAALRELKRIRSGMEATRKAVKAPVLELGKAIDAKAADFIEDVLKQEGRLTGMVNHFERKQRDQARADAERLEREKAEALALQKKADEEKDPDKKQAFTDQAFDKQMEADAAAGTIALSQPRGLVVREKVNFRIKDPIVFVQAYPQFFKWNADNESLKLDRMRVLDELNREDRKGVFHMTHFPEELAPAAKPAFVKPPGMEIFADLKTHVR